MCLEKCHKFVEFSDEHHHCMPFLLKMHYDCECVTATESVVVSGRCEGDCQLLSMFLVIFALIIFVTFTTSMPALAATLRYLTSYKLNMN